LPHRLELWRPVEEAVAPMAVDAVADLPVQQLALGLTATL
jgi:hypothetical protein